MNAKRTTLLISFGLGLALIVAMTPKGSHAEYPLTPSDNAAEESANSTEKVGNKICPISGEKIAEGKESEVEYKGKVYNLCCKMCLTDFNKDPEKFIQKIEIQQEEDESSVDDQ